MTRRSNPASGQVGPKSPAIPGGLVIQELAPGEAVAFIRQYHYSKVMPRLTKHYLGFYEGGVLSGVVTLGWGTQPLQTIRKLFPRHSLQSADYLEIGKMCFLPVMNDTRFFGSLVLSALVKWTRENTGCLFLYTLADGIMGKCGYVYQASNFRYLGSFKTSVYRGKATGEKIHPRSARTLLEENARFDGVSKRFWLSHGFCEYKGIEKIDGRMFRYIYPLSKRAAAILRAYPEYEGRKNPKDRDLQFTRRIAPGKYIPTGPPRFCRDICEYNTQKY